MSDLTRLVLFSLWYECDTYSHANKKQFTIVWTSFEALWFVHSSSDVLWTSDTQHVRYRRQIYMCGMDLARQETLTNYVQVYSMHFDWHVTKHPSMYKIAGKMSFTWFGPTPRVTIPDPELVREILSNKFGHFGKQRSTRIGKLLANGLANHEGEKWAKHRRILNPAFHHEKIKVPVQRKYSLFFSFFCGNVL